MDSKKSIIVIGAGFAGLSLSVLLAEKGFKVTLLEKNEDIGGRARLWKKDGFTFDMGPSWYLMPEVFERFYELAGVKREDYYTLKELDPYYKVYFGPGDSVTLGQDREANKAVFDSFEPKGGEKLEEYLKTAKYKYDIAMQDFLYKEYKWIGNFFNKQVVTKGLKLNLFNSLDKFTSKYFSSHKSKKILEYAMVFLGNSPQNAPALYSIMSHVDLNLGVFFPHGGLGEVALSMARLAEEKGVEIKKAHEVIKIHAENKAAQSVETNKGTYEADIVVMAGDYPHGEMELLEPKFRSFKEKYWKKKVMAPSMFIAYIGLNKKIESLEHHNLYFSENWNEHFETIFDKPSWPENPCFYLSAITKTEEDMAPEGGENLFLLVPIAAGLHSNEEIKQKYWHKALDHLENVTGENIRDHISLLRLYGPDDFTKDYHAFQGTALGMAHTLFQTAVFRPPHRSKKVKNLYYTGQYTHPGVGVPMTLIASELVANEIEKDMK